MAFGKKWNTPVPRSTLKVLEFLISPNFLSHMSYFLFLFLSSKIFKLSLGDIDLTVTTLWANSADDKFGDIFLIFPRKQDLSFHASCQILFFFGKNMKNISKCHLLKILLRVLSVKVSSKFFSTRCSA